eukprot:2724444-Pleurochrysis_carterae.AAC.2
MVGDFAEIAREPLLDRQDDGVCKIALLRGSCRCRHEMSASESEDDVCQSGCFDVIDGNSEQLQHAPSSAQLSVFF